MQQFGYADLLGLNTLANGYVDSLVVSSNLNLDYCTPSQILSLDSVKNVISTNLSGTTNQINISGVGTSDITLSTPQDINTTSSPTFADIYDTNLTINSLVATDATKS